MNELPTLWKYRARRLQAEPVLASAGPRAKDCGEAACVIYIRFVIKGIVSLMCFIEYNDGSVYLNVMDFYNLFNLKTIFTVIIDNVSNSRKINKNCL